MSSSEEEEELLVHVEFNGMLERDVLDQDPVFFKMIGVEGRRPIMQIGNQTFAGEYNDIVGTALFFEEDPNPPGGDPVFTRTPEHQLRYACKTRKVLQMSRVFLTKKNSADEAESKGEGSNSDTEADKLDTVYSRGGSCDELTMEVDEDPSRIANNKEVADKASSDLNALLEATSSGMTNNEVEKIVEEQVKSVTEASADTESDQNL
ncbi:hypothetical protein C0J52_16120 [Blattella germanica]|nr:hypothetical protein C0J52_16120 [Blattella germanica]